MAQQTVHTRKYQTVVAVTPNDTTNLATAPCDAIFVGGAGALALIDVAGNSVVLPGCLAGTIYPIRAVRILSTGTVATGIFALYD